MDDNKKIFKIIKEDKVYINGNKATFFNKKTTTLNHILKEILKNDKVSKKEDCQIKIILKDKNPPYYLNYKNDKMDFNFCIDKIEQQRKIDISNLFITFSKYKDNGAADFLENKDFEDVQKIKKIESEIKECLEKKQYKTLSTPSPKYWDILENIIITERENFKIDDNSHIVLQLNDNLKRIKDKNGAKIREPLVESLKILKKEIKDIFIQRDINILRDIPDFNRVEFDEIKAIEEISISIHIHNKIKNLSELELNQFFILNDSFLLLAGALKVNKSIKKLSLSSNKIGLEGCWSLNRVLFYNKTLVDLDLSYNFLTDDCIRLLSNGDDINKFSLVKLNLSNNVNITYVSGEYISNLIMLCPCLNSLNLSKTTVSKGFNVIFKKLINNIQSIKIQTLIVFGTKIDSYSLSSFAEYVGNKHCMLKSLVLSDNDLNTEGGQELLTQIPNNESLEELYLFNCNLDNKHAPLICKIIHSNKSLQKLYLYKNNITNEKDLKSIFYELVFLYNNKDGYKKILQKLQTKPSMNNEPFMTNLNRFIQSCEETEYIQKDSYLEKKNLKIVDLSKNGNDKIELDFKFMFYLMNLSIDKLDISGNFLLKPQVPTNGCNTFSPSLNSNSNPNLNTSLHDNNCSNQNPNNGNKQEDQAFITQLFCDVIDILKSENQSRVFIN